MGIVAPEAEAAGGPRLAADGRSLSDGAGQVLLRLEPADEGCRVVDAKGRPRGQLRREGGAWVVEDAAGRPAGQLAAAYRATAQGCFARWSVTDAAYHLVATVEDSGEVRDLQGRVVGRLRAHVPEAAGLLLLR
ncbi:MAG: hypothetical protein VKS61_03410 [Candidatus Sericytochromatia bacterium]|nr:hypothetical protein [Candidatus Sericytochromatia bacterium]